MVRVTSPTTRFTVREYFRMARAGLFDDARVELINGRIYRMAPQNNPHMLAISRTARTLQAVESPTEWVIIQGTLKLDRFTAPDPDFLWLPVPPGTPERQWPSPILLIEVSHTTYKKDSGIKLRKYAQVKVPDYWIFNLPADRIEVYRDPENPTGLLADCGYASVQHFLRGQYISPLLRSHVQLLVDDLLPQRSQT